MPRRKLSWYNMVGLAAALVFALFPIFWMVSTSFKPAGEWASIPPTWISGQATFDNYSTLFASYDSLFKMAGRPAWRALLDSFVVAGSATVLALVIGLMGAIGLSRHRAGGELFGVAVLSVRAIQAVTLAIPLVILFSWMRLLDSYIGLILADLVFTMPLAFWMLKSFLDELPKEIEEAGMMDGLSRWGAYFRITVPLIRGGLLATALFIFIVNWSEFLFASVLTEKNVVPISVYLRFHEGLIGVQAAIATMAALPIVVVGFAIQKQLARAFTLGAVKR
ncbi:MAG: carbohydrate ABC transporter permease [Alphaproteobacteria bacterium]